jgi:hypothetical protein
MTAPSQADYGAWRGQWLDQIHDDPKMTGDMCRVMYGLTRYTNSGQWFGLPGNVALAKTAHVSVRTVQRALALAESRGHLLINEPERQWPRKLVPILKQGMTICPSVHGRGDKGGDKDFEVLPQDQPYGGRILRILKESKERSPAARSSTRLSEDWKVDEAEQTFALGEGLNQSQIDYQEQKFRKYWHKADGKKKDWGLAWQSWITREIEWRKGVENLPRAADTLSSNAPHNRVFAEVTSESWIRWDKHLRTLGRGAPQADFHPDVGGPLKRGWFFDSEYPPDRATANAA